MLLKFNFQPFIGTLFLLDCIILVPELTFDDNSFNFSFAMSVKNKWLIGRIIEVLAPTKGFYNFSMNWNYSYSDRNENSNYAILHDFARSVTKVKHWSVRKQYLLNTYKYVITHTLCICNTCIYNCTISNIGKYFNIDKEYQIN